MFVLKTKLELQSIRKELVLSLVLVLEFKVIRSPFTIRKLGIKLDLRAALMMLLEYSRMYTIGNLFQAEVL